MHPDRWSRLVDYGVIAFLAACLAAAGAALYYHGQRLEDEAATTERRLLEADARHTLDQLEQTFHATDLTLQSLLETGYATHDADTWNRLLSDALRHAPYLRSLSLLDDAGRVTASSNPANIGLRPALDDYLPLEAERLGVLRIGALHAGRDLADSRPLGDPAAVSPALGYLPVIRALNKGESDTLSLLAALNVDYLLNRVWARELGPNTWIEVLRYDGALLVSTRDWALEPALQAANADIVAGWRSGKELGSLDQTLAGRTLITAWRVARMLPLGVLARSDRAHAVTAARQEIRRQSLLLAPLIALAVAGVFSSYWALRQMNRRRIAAQEHDLDRMARLLDALPACVLLFGQNGRVLLSNRTWQAFAAEHAAQLAHGAPHYRDYARLLHCEPGATSAEEGIGAVLLDAQVAFEGEFALADGQCAVQVLVRPFSHERLRGVVVLQLDITDRHRSEERNRLLYAALEAAASAIVITGPDAVIEWANPAFTTLTGYSRDEALGRKPEELVHSGRQDAAFYRALWDTILRGEVWRGELVNKRKDGQLYHEALTITPVRDRSGRLAHFVAFKEDISQRKRQEDELKRLANTDPLTGVCNRRAFMAHLSAELARVQRYGHSAAVLMLDLDHFKTVNDRYGHAAGDAVLQRFTELTAALLRQTDILGRLGGEEFAVLLPQTDEAGACGLAERIRVRVASQPIDYDGRTIPITVSIGVALLEVTDPRADMVLIRADQALYRAKQGGRNRVESAATPG